MKNSTKLVIAFVATVLILMGIGYCGNAYYLKESVHHNCKVTDKDRTHSKDGGSDARIYTSNCGTLKVADNIFKGDMNSADRYSRIQVGHAYDFTTTGWRFGLTSTFPNIIHSKDVGK